MYHANIIIGENGKDFVFEILEKELNFAVKANPDFLLLENQTFGIDDARGFGEWAIGKPLSGDIKVSLIVAKSVTHEAQNALLKIFEEPPEGTFIFLNIENLGGLLTTLISRTRVLNVSAASENSIAADKSGSLKFLHSNIKEKLSLIRLLSNKEDKTDMKELLNNLEKIAYKSYSKDSANNPIKTKNLKNMLTAKIFASARGSSPRMLLEWLSCVL